MEIVLEDATTGKKKSLKALDLVFPERTMSKYCPIVTLPLSGNKGKRQSSQRRTLIK